MPSSKDRGSYRMSWLSAAVICLLHYELGDRGAELRFTGRLLTAACAFAVLTGGRGFCKHLRNKLTPAIQQQLPSWCTELLSSHDVEKVWSESAAYGCEADQEVRRTAGQR